MRRITVIHNDILRCLTNTQRQHSASAMFVENRLDNLKTIIRRSIVSWIRRSDWHILTTGTYSYTTDVRFNVLHKEGSDDWTLQLKYVDTRDNGTYECQSYTGTGVVSKYVNLHVSKPRATIHGPTELHVQEGETVTLVCVIQQSKPPFVFWYHGIDLLNNEDERSRFYVDTEVEGGKTRSSLTIKEARYTDSGNYSCLPPHVDSASVMVYVTKGDEAAAVYRRGASSATSFKPSIASFIFLTFSVLNTVNFSILWGR
ncbi:zwei Ig domain protein zig-8-like [Palaemon carinicauda]|uniref:zwei Ig domain protein zig-8-like n=1 Tax=Palaemon carinicauda TaxID=392227 RepID=UPI0035B587C2